MQQAVCRSASRPCISASLKPVAQQQAQPMARPVTSLSRRSALLGLGAGLTGLLSACCQPAQAASSLEDLVLPLVRPMDANGDGLLDVDEVRGMLQRTTGSAPPRVNVARDIMSMCDFNNDGDLSVQEFARGVSLDLAVDERWMRAMERDGGAGLSAAELAAGLGDLGERGKQVLPVAFNMADTDRNGVLSQREAQMAMNLIANGLLGDFNTDL